MLRKSRIEAKRFAADRNAACCSGAVEPCGRIGYRAESSHLQKLGLRVTLER